MSTNGKNSLSKLPYIVLVLTWLGLGYLIVWPVFGPQVKNNSAVNLLAVSQNKKTVSFAKTLEELLKSQQFLRLNELSEDISWLDNPVNAPVLMPGLGGQELIGRINPFILPKQDEIFAKINNTTTVETNNTSSNPINTTSTP